MTPRLDETPLGGLRPPRRLALGLLLLATSPLWLVPYLVLCVAAAPFFAAEVVNVVTRARRLRHYRRQVESAARRLEAMADKYREN